ncbi:OmpA/MotB family protein [Saccharospirillum impatiens]|uniref:OmpA/MotB family protein n=1 Tax=Saccharospirillum impatiens TaxID=169438 RepID=UPI00040DC09B|nr:OmpA family protein [Saccharospirillum impatiens]
MPRSTLWALFAALLLALFTAYVLWDNQQLTQASRTLEQQVSDQSADLLDARTRAQNLIATNRELEQRLTQFTSQQTDLSDIVTELQVRLTEVTEEYTNLVATQQQSQQQLEAASNRQQALARLESEAEARAQANQALTERLDQQIRLNERYQQQLQAANTALTGRQEEVADLESRLSREQQAIDALEQQLTALSDDRSQAIEQRADGSTVIQLPEAILFDSGSAQLNNQSVAVLEDVARAIESFEQYNIRVIGHSDSLPVVSMRRTYPTNWELSSARASAAVRRLTELGVTPQRLSATGVADTQPQVEETDDGSRQRNRRIEIVLEPLPQR